MTGGQPILGWIVIAAGTVAALFAIVAAIRFIARPGEEEPDHPKRAILREDR